MTTTATLCLLHVAGIFSLHFVGFAVVLPELWADQGFPAILDLLGVKLARLDAFDDISQDGRRVRVAVAAAGLHTLVVVLGVVAGSAIKERCQQQYLRVVSTTKKSTEGGDGLGLLLLRPLLEAVVLATILAAVAYVTSRQLFMFSFSNDWTHGFDYGYHFFKRGTEGAAASFGRVAASVIAAELSVSLVTRMCTRRYNGLFPSFSRMVVLAGAAAFLVSYTYGYFLVSTTTTSAAHDTDASGPWTVLDAGTHAVCVALGAACGFLVQDVLAMLVGSRVPTTPVEGVAPTATTTASLRVAATVSLAAAFFVGVQVRYTNRGNEVCIYIIIHARTTSVAVARASVAVVACKHMTLSPSVD